MIALFGQDRDDLIGGGALRNFECACLETRFLSGGNNRIQKCGSVRNKSLVLQRFCDRLSGAARRDLNGTDRCGSVGAGA